MKQSTSTLRQSLLSTGVLFLCVSNHVISTEAANATEWPADNTDSCILPIKSCHDATLESRFKRLVWAAPPPESHRALSSVSGVIGVVRFGDTLSKIADRYGITLAELLRLNPGLDIARLVVGSQVRLAAPLAPVRTTALSLISTGSGVLRWPDISIPATSQRNTTQLPSASEPIQKPLSQREQALLEQIRSQPSGQWRTYGECHYDWSQWKLYANGIRSTNVDCGHEKLIIGVSCTKLLVARYDPQSGWSNWRSPASGDRVNKGQDEMTAALCANIKP